MAEQSKLKRPASAATTLNDLPDCILITILSLLPSIMDMIESSFISRRWRNLWHFIPTLDFEPYYDESEDLLQLINAITQVLLNRPKSIPLTAFRLAIRYFHRHRSLISSWLRYALDCGVQDLRLTFDGKGNDDEPPNLYAFHFSDLRDKSVKRLSLCDCEIVLPGYFSSRFDSLRVVELISVDVVDELLTHLVSKCVNLEELCLNLFDGVRNFRICSKSLKVLKLLNFVAGANGEHSSIEICIPNLSKIVVHDFHVATFKGDLSSVTEAEVLFSNWFDSSEKYWGNVMKLLSGVENLAIKGCIPSKFESDECFQLPRLKHLELMLDYQLDVLLGASPLLERLPALETLVFGIVHREDYDDEDERNDLAYSKAFLKELNKPNAAKFLSLREVKVRGFTNRITDSLILHLLEKRRVVLNKVVLLSPANLGKAPVVLNPASDGSSNVWHRYINAKVVEVFGVVLKMKAQLAEAERVLKCLQEDSEEDSEGDD